MPDTARGYPRDVLGRFVGTRNVPESGEGKFETYTDLSVEVQGADPADLAYTAVPRHAPEGDGLAGRPYPGALRPRTTRLVRANVDVTGVHAIPDRATLHREAMIEAAGPRAGDMDPIPYLIGNIDGIEV
jgi:hypothetical protein